MHTPVPSRAAWALFAAASVNLLACPAHRQDPGGGEWTTAEDGDDGGSMPDDPVPTSGAASPGDSTAPVTEGTGSTSGEPGTTTDASTGETGETGETTGPVPPGTCGDGVVDEGEGCDLSYENNKDDGACTKACQTAFCGDGLVWSGMEICDLGPANNDQTYSGCTQVCVWGPRCGDGVAQIEEECDASAPPLENEVACEADNCRFTARVAFVTSEVYTGKFGGLAGADAKCVAAAMAGGLDNANHFLAYVGDDVGAPADRLVNGAKAKGYPYARLDGKKIADDLDDLFFSMPHVPIDVTEFGETLPPMQFSEYAWTGVNFDGEAYGPDCEGWGTDYFEYSGLVGKISPDSDSQQDLFKWRDGGHWVRFTTDLCYAKHRLYCFED